MLYGAILAASFAVLFLAALSVVGTGAAVRLSNGGWVFNARNVLWSALLFGLFHVSVIVAAIFYAAHQMALSA